MTDGRGGCCIARGGHVADYNSSKMDMIMLKFRPIAPKPAEGAAAADGGSLHANPAVGGGRGRRKSNINNMENNNNSSSGSSYSNRRRKCNNNNGRKRKSSSKEEKSNHHPQNHDEMNDQDDQRADPTLLPLFPEAPDLSPTSMSNNNNQVHNNNTVLPLLTLNYDGV